MYKFLPITSSHQKGLVCQFQPFAIELPKIAIFFLCAGFHIVDSFLKVLLTGCTEFICTVLGNSGL